MKRLNSEIHLMPTGWSHGCFFICCSCYSQFRGQQSEQTKLLHYIFVWNELKSPVEMWAVAAGRERPRFVSVEGHYLLWAKTLVGLWAILPRSLVSSILRWCNTLHFWAPHLSTVILWICIGAISCQPPSGSKLPKTLRHCQEQNLWSGIQRGGTISPSHLVRRYRRSS